MNENTREEKEDNALRVKIYVAMAISVLLVILSVFLSRSEIISFGDTQVETTVLAPDQNYNSEKFLEEENSERTL